MVMLNIPLNFILARVDLSWREVFFAVERGLVAPEFAVELAERRLEADDAPCPALVDLASPSRVPIRQLLAPLVAVEPEMPEVAIRETWLFLVLAWLYSVRDELRDPLAAVEAVYVEFDYPDQIAPLIDYMTPVDEARGLTPEEFQRRLFDRWRAFVEAGEAT